MSCVHFTPAQGRSRGRAPLFLIQEYPRLPGFPSDVYGIMTQRSDSARPRPYAELDQALHTLGGYLEKRSCQLFYYCVHMALPSDTAIQTRCLRSYVSFYVRCSARTWSWTRELLHGSYHQWPSRGRLAACVCIADFLLLPFRMCMHEELPSLELLLAWAVSDISSPGLAYFVSALLRPPFAEYYSMTGELTSSLWFICLCWLFHLRKVCWFWAKCNK